MPELDATDGANVAVDLCGFVALPHVQDAVDTKLDELAEEKRAVHVAVASQWALSSLAFVDLSLEPGLPFLDAQLVYSVKDILDNVEEFSKHIEGHPFVKEALACVSPSKDLAATVSKLLVGVPSTMWLAYVAANFSDSKLLQPGSLAYVAADKWLQEVNEKGARVVKALNWDQRQELVTT